MRIEKILPSPGSNYVNPTIILGIQIIYDLGKEAITGVDGWLKTEEDVHISPLIEVLNADRREEKISARGTYQDRNNQQNQTYYELTAQLNEKTLEYIEKERTKNAKKDIKLKIELNVSSITNNARIAPIFKLKSSDFGLPYEKIPDSSGREVDFTIMASAFDNQYNSGFKDGWIISGDNGAEYLTVGNYKLKDHFTIPSSDWINDYAPRFGLGNFSIIEIPTGSELIPDAWSYVKKADVAYMNWDSKSVYANCRECGSLLNIRLQEKFGKTSYTFKERWGSNYARFNHISSLDLHLEEKIKDYPDEPVEIKKTDAEHLIIITKALVNLAQELFKE